MGFNCHLHLDYDFQPLIDAFLVHKVVILSYLLAFTIAPPATLRYWIAVQHSTDVPVVPVETLNKATKPLSKWKIARSAALRLPIMGGLVYALFQLPIDGAKVVAGVCTGLPAFGCVLAMSTTMRRKFGKSSVFRNPGGYPVEVFTQLTTTKVGKVANIARVLFAAAVAVTAVLKFEASTVLAATAVSFTTLRGCNTNFSTRIYYKLVAAFTALCFVLTGVVVIAVTYIKNNGGSISEEDQAGISGMAEVLYNWTNWYLPAIQAVGPGILISACLRFDYQNYLDSLPEGSESPVTLEEVPRPETPVRKSGKVRRFLHRVVGQTGVVIPASLPRFAPIYFSVAYSLWACAYVGMLYVEAYTPAKFTDNYNYSSCAFAVALPLMCGGLWVLALLRGEFKKFWTYKEVWQLPAAKVPSPVAPVTVAPVDAPAQEKVEVVEEKEVLVEV